MRKEKFWRREKENVERNREPNKRQIDTNEKSVFSLTDDAREWKYVIINNKTRNIHWNTFGIVELMAWAMCFESTSYSISIDSFSWWMQNCGTCPFSSSQFRTLRALRQHTTHTHTQMTMKIDTRDINESYWQIASYTAIARYRICPT